MAWERHLLEHLTIIASKYQELWFKENPGQTGVFQVVSVKTLWQPTQRDSKMVGMKSSLYQWRQRRDHCSTPRGKQFLLQCKCARSIRNNITNKLKVLMHQPTQTDIQSAGLLYSKSLCNPENDSLTNSYLHSCFPHSKWEVLLQY